MRSPRFLAKQLLLLNFKDSEHGNKTCYLIFMQHNNQIRNNHNQTSFILVLTFCNFIVILGLKKGQFFTIYVLLNA